MAETHLLGKPLQFGDPQQIHYLKKLKNLLRVVTIRHITEGQSKEIEEFFKKVIVPENNKATFNSKIANKVKIPKSKRPNVNKNIEHELERKI